MSTWVDMSRRLRTTLLAIVAVLALLPAAVPAAEEAAWAPYDRPAEFAVVSETDIPLTMRDGVVLRADVHRPDAPGRFPVILTQTPYSKGGAGLVDELKARLHPGRCGRVVRQLPPALEPQARHRKGGAEGEIRTACAKVRPAVD